jgi:hypothetical protein
MSLVTVRLAAHHDRPAFTCGNRSLDLYIQRQAGQDIRRDVAQVFVHEGEPSSTILGYYTLSMSGVDIEMISKQTAGKLPRYDVVPAALLGRLAVSMDAQGRGMGKLLLLDAVRRIAELSANIGTFAVVVDAIDERAAVFYRRFQFEPLLDQPSRLLLPLAVARKYI